jgi:hypothetical protein
LLTQLKDEDLVFMEKNSGMLAFNTRQGPIYLSQTSDKLYHIYYSAGWTSDLLGDEENTNQYIQKAEDKGIDADRESEIKQIIDDNITTLLSDSPSSLLGRMISGVRSLAMSPRS